MSSNEQSFDLFDNPYAIVDDKSIEFCGSSWKDPLSLDQAIDAIARLPHNIAPNHNSEIIDQLFLGLWSWLKLYLQHQEELSPLLHQEPSLLIAKPEADFSVSMLTFAEQLLPRSAKLQKNCEDSHLKLWLLMEYGRACGMLGRAGITRMPNLSINGRLAGEKVTRRYLQKAFKYHRHALNCGYYEREREIPPKKIWHELLLDVFLTEGIQLAGYHVDDRDFKHHCAQFLNAFEHYCLRPGSLFFVDKDGNLHLTAPRKKLPPPKGFQR